MRISAFLQRHEVSGYFLLTFLISWAGAFLVAAPYLLRGQSIPILSGILMFPVMLLGPSVSGIIMTATIDGRQGLKNLFASMLRARVGARWYTVLLLPPALVLAVLLCLRALVSPAFAPNHFYLGILFGIPAGIFEEIGWMGYAFRKMSAMYSPLKAGVVLGGLWALWHLPVINFLGAATPHGRYWPLFFLAFGLAMTAMRIVIAWLYVNTQSVLLAQLMHISSTGTLAIFSPRVTPAQEVAWYAVYGVVLWAVAAIIAVSHGHELRA